MTPPIITTIGRTMRIRGMSQKQAAAALGTSQSAVSRYLSGATSPGVDIVDRWLRLLSLDVRPVDPPSISRDVHFSSH